MAANPAPFISPEEYLAIDSKNDRPSEYLNGRMVEVESSTENHSLILTNLVTAIVTSLRAKNSSCRAHLQALRVHMPRTGPYAYPDFVMACGERAFDAHDTLLNPILIIEALSPTTQSYDRGDKFASYRSIPSLQEYWTVAQDQIHVERWTIVNAHWTLTEYAHPQDALVHPHFEIALSDIYRDIQFMA
jgi:Uma2 family endonuclease